MSNPANPMKTPNSVKYYRTIQPVNNKGVPITIDVYNVIEAYRVTCPAVAHAIKKLLCAGLRDKGSRIQDLEESIICITRAIELENQRTAENNKEL